MGCRRPALLHELRAALYRAMSAGGHKDADSPFEQQCYNGQCGDLIDSAEAAHLLKVSRRQARRLVHGLEGARCGSIWLTRRSAVLALAQEREAAAS